MTHPASSRPDLVPGLSSEEFQRWYWLKTELVDFARTLGIRASGGKELLTARIAASLDGRDFAEPAPIRSSGPRQLVGELSAATVIPAGQRCSQVVRRWLEGQVGSGFRFDAPMRAFFAQSDGTPTMQDALDCWHASRNQGERTIDSQFEYNRFTRTWYEEHPDGLREDLLSDWKEYRGRPIDGRGERDRRRSASAGASSRSFRPDGS